MKDFVAGVYYKGQKAIGLDYRYTSKFEVREGTTSIGSISGSYTSDEKPGTLILPESIKSIGNINAPLTKIEISEKSQVFCSVDGVLYSKDKQVLARYPNCHEGEQFVVPDGVKLIYHDAFRSCRNLKRVVLPDGALIIDSNAFCNCINLTSVVLSDTVKIIKESAFSHTPLEKVELTARPITIEELAFTPNLYSRHGKEKFADTILYFRHNELRIPLVLVDNWGITNDGKILAEFLETEDVGRKLSLYGDMKKSEYKIFMAFYLAVVHGDEDCLHYIKRSKSKWSADKINLYADLIDCVLDKEKRVKKTKSAEGNKKKNPPLSKWSIINLPDGSYEIEKYKGKDTVVEVPDEYNGEKITSIGEKAFSPYRAKACAEIEKVVIPEGVEIIKDSAFEHCGKLTEISLPESLKEIGKNAFERCNSIQEIKIPDSVTLIDKKAFQSCKQLKEFSFPPQLTFISEGVIFDCTEITLIRIGSLVTAIGYNSFDRCKKLERVEVVEGDEVKDCFLGRIQKRNVEEI